MPSAPCTPDFLSILAPDKGTQGLCKSYELCLSVLPPLHKIILYVSQSVVDIKLPKTWWVLNGYHFYALLFSKHQKRRVLRPAWKALSQALTESFCPVCYQGIMSSVPVGLAKGHQETSPQGFHQMKMCGPMSEAQGHPFHLPHAGRSRLSVIMPHHDL